MVGPIVQSDSDEELRKQRKREKKERRRLEKEQALNAEAEQPEIEQAAEVESEEARRQRKAEKKERKRKRKAEEEGAEAATASTAADDSTASPSSKSAKLHATSAPSSSTAAFTSEDAEAYRTKHRIQISAADSKILPIQTFAAAGFLPSLLAATATFTAPSPIQSQCWPVLMQRRDCIAIADTGSGKTLGFLLPSLHHILTDRAASASSTSRRLPATPSMLVMSPTRELAMQTKAVCDEATKKLELRCAVIYGGVDKWQQKKELEAGVAVIVATPGRLLALIEEGWIALSGVKHLVLDEADRMLDMGFEPDIRAIMKHVESGSAKAAQSPAAGTVAGSGRNGRQTLMFSATWPASVQKLAHEFITDAVHINIGDVELKANHRVRQLVEVMQTDYDKQKRLLSLLAQLHSPQSALAVKGRPPRVLLFVLYKKEVDSMDRTVQRAGYKCVAISGDKGQQQREAALQSFRQGKINILVATDVVGRGLDIDDIDVVINYTFPLTVEDYVHRIGRTGRGGKSGTSYTFFTRNEKHLSGELINVLREAGEEVPSELMSFGTGVKRKEHGFFGNFFKKTDDGQEMPKAVKVRFD